MHKAEQKSLVDDVIIQKEETEVLTHHGLVAPLENKNIACDVNTTDNIQQISADVPNRGLPQGPITPEIGRLFGLFRTKQYT
jgi:hypothetical protein